MFINFKAVISQFIIMLFILHMWSEKQLGESWKYRGY